MRNIERAIDTCFKLVIFLIFVLVFGVTSFIATKALTGGLL